MRQNRETLQCCAHSESDCRALIHAARCGLIRRIVARLSNAEKRRIKPGELYIFNEAESGIRRWTDKRVWTPSRVHGIFLIYRDVGGAMVKKTYSCELDDGKYHLVMYGLVEWEESGECCTVFHGVVDQIKLQLGGSAALWAKESKRYGAVADQERWPQDAPAERGGIAAYELLEPVEKLFEHAERSSNANFFPDLCHARAEAPPCAAPAKDSSGIFYPSELPLSDSFARKYFADATGRELCNYFAGAASGQFDSVHADAQPESVASNRRVLDSADILDSLVRPGASTREENLADFNIYLNSILSVDGNDSSPRSRQKSGTAGGPRDRNGESTGDRAGECI
ncbi:hypothetical protein PAPHI01_2382 [Pancytospora philotis]|nr:hypothetical protein PAPHI01_2382 [Pancytospora philotis]